MQLSESIISFSKYHGAGNDFILIDDRELIFPEQKSVIAHLCHRRFGIGGDGLILIRKHDVLDFQMIYFNADGGEGSMCGNGGRCAVMFAKQLGIIDSRATFQAYDGKHEAVVFENGNVKLSMQPVKNILRVGNDFIMSTGSPHFVRFVENLDIMNVVDEGRRIRNSDRFIQPGINVNFVEDDRGIKMRTYERGVEDETLSCGTGTVAAAIALSLMKNDDRENEEWELNAPGGALKVYFKKESQDLFTDVWLEGNAVEVFKGTANMNYLPSGNL